MFHHQFRETVLCEEGDMWTGFETFETFDTARYDQKRLNRKGKAGNLRGLLDALYTLLQARLRTLSKWVRIKFLVVVAVICMGSVVFLLNHCYQSDVYHGGDVWADNNASTNTKVTHLSKTKAIQFVPTLLNDAHFQETIVDVNALAIELQKCVCAKDVGRNYDVLGIPMSMDQEKATSALVTTSLLFNA